MKTTYSILISRTSKEGLKKDESELRGAYREMIQRIRSVKIFKDPHKNGIQCRIRKYCDGELENEQEYPVNQLKTGPSEGSDFLSKKDT